MPATDITWADVTALAPELASVSIAGQGQVLAQVQLEVTSETWGSMAKANAAAVWLARHMATNNGAGGTGIVTQVTVGQVSKSFAQPVANGTSLASLRATKYGLEYLRLVRLWLPRFALT